MKQRIQANRPALEKSRKYISSAGATPNEIASTSESSSAPKRVPVRESRATRPSSMSRMPANTMNQPAHRKLPLKAETIAQNPKNRLPSVNALGMTTTTWRIGAPSHAFLPLHQLHSATTVTPARVVSPVCTSDARPDGQEEVHPRAEPDDAHALALPHLGRRPWCR